MIERLFPPEVMTLVATPEMWEGTLLPEEEACVARAVPKRRREFTAGRVAARRLLSLAGAPEAPLLAGADRMPIWPPGFVGSISHCDGLCAVAIARAEDFASIGLDVEGAGPLPEETIHLVCSESEVERACGATELARADAAKLLFSAKEAFYKCWFPVTRVPLDFHDVEVELDEGRGEFRVRLVKDEPRAALAAAMETRFARGAGHVASGVVLRGAAR